MKHPPSHAFWMLVINVASLFLTTAVPNNCNSLQVDIHTYLILVNVCILSKGTPYGSLLYPFTLSDTEIASFQQQISHEKKLIIYALYSIIYFIILTARRN